MLRNGPRSLELTITVQESKNLLEIGIRPLKEKTGSVKDRSRSGRPPKTTEREDRALKFVILNTPKTSSRAMTLKLAPSFIKNKVSYKLIQRRIKKFGLFSYVARKKPLLSDANIIKRFE